MFRYSDKPIFGKLETNPYFAAAHPNNATGNQTEFIRLQSELLNRLRQTAGSGGPNRNYAQGQGPGSPINTTFFASVQCTPDLSEKDCNDCLTYGFGNATKGKVGIRWFCPSCNFQIESNLRFFRHESEYEPDGSAPPTAPPTKPDGSLSPTITPTFSPASSPTSTVASPSAFLTFRTFERTHSANVPSSPTGSSTQSSTINDNNAIAVNKIILTRSLAGILLYFVAVILY